MRRVRGIISAAALASALSPGAAAAEEAAIDNRAALGVRSAMTLEAARTAAPTAQWVYEHRFMVDFSALCAVKGTGEDRETLFCAIVPERASERGSDKIEAVAVLSPSLKTREGAHVGMTVADAVKIYGAASLSYNVENESREFLSFENAPSWMNFQASSKRKTDGFAGIYPMQSDDAPSRVTSEFAPDAVIDTLWLY